MAPVHEPAGLTTSDWGYEEQRGLGDILDRDDFQEEARRGKRRRHRREICDSEVFAIDEAVARPG